MGKIREFNVGLLHFDEPFGLELTERLNLIEKVIDKDGHTVIINAEHILIHEVPLDYQSKYEMIIDRGSHILKHAVGVFMLFAFRGVYLINNPLSFHYFIANKDVGFSMAYDLGINVPKTYILPPHTTPMFSEQDFHYHKQFNWNKMIADIGWPCYLKPAAGRGAFDVHKIHNFEELWYHYNNSGAKVMTLQAAIETPHEWQVRCLCIGRKIIPIKYIFRSGDCSEYIFDTDYLTPEQGRQIIDSAKILNRIFGYEMNSVEFIVDHQGIPWAIDFNNPIPDARKQILGDVFYRDYLDALIQRVCEIAYERPTTCFLPEINGFSLIAQMNIPKEEKLRRALRLANRYYYPIP